MNKQIIKQETFREAFEDVLKLSHEELMQELMQEPIDQTIIDAFNEFECMNDVVEKLDRNSYQYFIKLSDLDVDFSVNSLHINSDNNIVTYKHDLNLYTKKIVYMPYIATAQMKVTCTPIEDQEESQWIPAAAA